MSKQHNVFFGFDDVVQCFKLTNRHGLILNKIEIDRVTIQGVDADKGKDPPFFINQIDNFQCLFRICGWIDLMIGKVFIIPRCSD